MTIRTKQQLIEAAKSAGKAATDSSGRTVLRGKSAKMVIHADGTILRSDVRLDLCRPMTVAQAAKLLALV